MERITRQDLTQMMNRGDDFVLVEVLAPDEFKQHHLPNAINVPIDSAFEDAIQREVPDKDRPVVVYCANIECDASPRAAKKLETLGYRQVYDYAAGKADWEQAGLPVDGGSSS